MPWETLYDWMVNRNVIAIQPHRGGITPESLQVLGEPTYKISKSYSVRAWNMHEYPKAGCEK